MRNIAVPVLIFVTALGLSLVAAEEAARLLRIGPPAYQLGGNGNDSVYQPSKNPILGYEMKPSYRSNNPDCHNTFPFTNSHGFRDIERTVEKPAGTRRIILLGDSVVAGHGICDFKQTISQKLESQLKETEVLNVSAGGYCTRAEVELLKDKALEFRPDEVALLFVGNDFVNENTKISFPNDRPHFLNFFFKHSALFRAAVWPNDLFGFRTQLDPSFELKEESESSGRSNVEDGFELLSKLANENGFHVTVFTWPYFSDRAVEPMENLLLNRSKFHVPDVEALASEFHFKFVKLEPAFQSDFASRSKTYSGRYKNPSPRWFYTVGDGTHPSVLGAEIAAQAIASAY